MLFRGTYLIWTMLISLSVEGGWFFSNLFYFFLMRLFWVNRSKKKLDERGWDRLSIGLEGEGVNEQMGIRANGQMDKWANGQMGKWADLQICRFADLQICIFADLQICNPQSAIRNRNHYSPLTHLIGVESIFVSLFWFVDSSMLWPNDFLSPRSYFRQRLPLSSAISFCHRSRSEAFPKRWGVCQSFPW